MAVNQLLFKDLPFQPSRNQVFYIENGYDADVNNFIQSNYSDLKSMFADNGMDFYYLPYLLREHDIEAKVRYYAPYLSSQLLTTKVQSNALVPYLSDDDTRKNLQPSLVFEGNQKGGNGEVMFLQVPLSDIDFSQSKSVDDLVQWVEQMRDAYHREIVQERVCYYQSEDFHAPHCCGQVETSSSKKRFLEGLFNRFNKKLEMPEDDVDLQKTEEEYAEEQSLMETEKVLRELRLTVQKLRLEGVSLMAIHEFIDKQEPLSRMTITPDYRIFLPDYNNIEIEMAALPKAIYFLFLRYPNGIIYKHMQDHYNELLNIYRQLRPHTDEARINLTITKVVNPVGNALNENIARIRKAFIEKFDEHLANHYIITGERGLQYAIPLDRELITWEE
ncbi:MAG: hypothetical protein IJM78_06255 [Prevotella sp.]|nr:hypothetical protein [Prevotella sp.]